MNGPVEEWKNNEEEQGGNKGNHLIIKYEAADNSWLYGRRCAPNDDRRKTAIVFMILFIITVAFLFVFVFFLFFFPDARTPSKWMAEYVEKE